jgi:hypothetical protein
MRNRINRKFRIGAASVAAALLMVPIAGPAEEPSDGNEWIVEGAHLMIVAPAELLEAFPTDPQNGGPYVMWKGTPYAHLMVPIGPRD